MEIGNWPSTRFLNDTYRAIRGFGLEANVAELEAFGFTIIPDVLDADLIGELKEKIIAVGERRSGKKIDPLRAEGLEGRLPGTPVLIGLLFEDPIFERLLLEPKLLSLVYYLMGQSVKLTSVSSHLKAGSADGLRLHADAANGIPAPMPLYATFCNLTYALTDYTREGGALAMVPGSHRRCRQPTPEEAPMNRGRESAEAVPIEVKAGSAILWHGNTWHGAFPRDHAGLRMNLIYAFCRQFIETQEAIRRRVPADAWERHKGDEVFAGLMGEHSYHGWETTADFEKVGPRNYQAGIDWNS